LAFTINEAPRRKRRGIKRNSAEATRLSILRSPSSGYGAVRYAIHPRGKPQGILAKANKKGGLSNQAPLFYSSFPLTVVDLLKQTPYLSGLYIHVHPAERRIGTGPRHQADGSGTGTEKFRAGIDEDVPDR